MSLAVGSAQAVTGHSVTLQHLGTTEGLTQGTVYKTLQDSQGFVWLATEDGLIRYDGHQVRRYASSAERDALPGNFIFSLAEDQQTDLWIAVKGAGLARWNRRTDTFTVFRHDKNDPQSLASDFVRSVMIDSKNRLWICTLDAGVDVFDAKTRHFIHLDSHAADPLVSDEVYSMREDRRGEVWIGTANGIDRRLFDGRRFSRSGYQKAGAALLAGNRIQQMIDANDGTFWIASFESGVFHLDYAGRILENLRHDAQRPDSLSNDEVHALLDDHEGHLWIGTADGLDSLNQSNKRIERYVHDKSDPNSLSDSFVMSLYEDATGLLWIGTRAGGVNRLNAHSWEFGGNRPAWLDGKSITAFADASTDHVWVGTLGAGLFNVDVRSGDASNLDTLLGGSNMLGDRRVMSLHRDRRGDLWIGTLAAGLKRLSADGHLSSIPVHTGDPHATSAPGIAAIYESTQGLLWIGTHGGGANILDPVAGTIRQLPFGATEPGSTGSANVTSFAEDRSGHIWIGTDNAGVDLADAAGLVIKHFTHDPADHGSLSSNTVYAVSTDAAGRVWIATDGGGLNEMIGSAADPEHVRFTSYSIAEGLSSATLYAALPDASGLWLSGDAGLMRFDPSTHTIRSYHREHGLQGEEFNSGAYLRTVDGRLCFGGPDGYNIFNPSLITGKSVAPRIALTAIEILGVPAREDSAYWSLHDIRLDYQANVVSFDFAVLDFTSPAGNRLAYRVSGLTDQWIELNSQRRITLTNLDAGVHILEVRAASADSAWSEVPFRLAIHKIAAPWRSTAAYAAYALLLILIIVSGVQVQRRKLRQALAAKQSLESEVVMRTQELLEANRQLIIAGEAKSEFLSRMGHELRTPMNGVLGMTELIARSQLTPTQAQQIQTIRASAGTLLQILNDLLDLSKAQAGKITLENLPIDLNELMEESVATFAGAAEIKGLSLLVCPLVDGGLTTFGDPLRLRQVLMNLIGNAVKFTERGEIVVTGTLVAAASGATQLEIAVTDTGIGIAPAIIANLFEPFSQADETMTRRFGGSGLGLSICQELAHLMGGAITVESQPLAGSTFTLAIPLKVAPQDMTSPPAPIAGALLVMTRRRALSKALSRHAALLRMSIRYAEPSAGLKTAPNELLVLDADSFPTVVDEILHTQLPERTLIVASTSIDHALGLEHRLAPAQLLRGAIAHAALRRAVQRVLDPSALNTPVMRDQGALLPQFRAHVLLVEDDNVNAAVGEGYLAALGCSSTWVSDGEAAIARSKVERFDLILMDLNMPGLDGYQTTRHIRQAAQGHPRIPLIALTASNAAEHRAACLTAGMDDILTKPYTLAECAALLRRWVDHKSVREAPQNTVKPLQGLDKLDDAVLSDLQRVCADAPGALFNRLVAMFERNSADALAELKTSIAARDFEDTRALAHKLKGAAANVGAMAFSVQVGALEQACMADPAALSALYDSLSAARSPLLAELRRHLTAVTA